MSSQAVYELIGYAASALVVVSLTMTSVLRLRVINLAGAALFTAYGVLIDALPIVLVNGVIVVINLYFLWKVRTDREFFSTLEVSPESRYLAEFLRFYGGDIAEFQPSFDGSPRPGGLHLLILRNMVPAGLLIGVQEGETLRVALDYAIPQYRDFKLGRFLFGSDQRHFVERGITAVVSRPETPRHNRYLERMGFRRDGDRYIRVLP